MISQKVFYQEAELVEHLKSHKPSFYFSSRTSTVIPYDKINEYLSFDGDFFLCDLSKLPSRYELNEKNNLVIRGPLTWADARAYLRSLGRNIMTSPTEELALITAGAATSCTGERCFGLDNMRSQIRRIKYFDYDGQEHELHASKKIAFKLNSLSIYQQEFSHYSKFKNAPYPRFEVETDLMVGTEGQLGVISEIEIATIADDPVQHLFILLPRWEMDDKKHLELFYAVQALREDIFSVEMIDAQSFSYLKAEERLGQDQDVIFMEIKLERFEKVIEHILKHAGSIDENDIYEITENKFHQIRASVPRAIFEENSKQGVVKMGTDVQVVAQDFPKLLSLYRQFSQSGIGYNLFGHFGDAHLHFNFMPKKDNIDQCLPYLELLYKNVLEWKGSPFAEHGIGLLKQKYIKAFHQKVHYDLFKELKDLMDPHRQFFPQGFMNQI